MALLNDNQTEVATGHLNFLGTIQFITVVSFHRAAEADRRHHPIKLEIKVGISSFSTTSLPIIFMPRSIIVLYN